MCYEDSVTQLHIIGKNQLRGFLGSIGAKKKKEERKGKRSKDESY
jgi:hypothetical protein